MEEHLFRESVLQRLDSVDRLESLIRVVSPLAWAALAGLGLMVVKTIREGRMERDHR